MSNKVNLAVPLRIPKVDSEDVEGCVNFIDIDLLVCCGVPHDESHAWWGCDGSPILITKSTHPGPDGLLHNIETVDAAFEDGRYRLGHVGRARNNRQGSLTYGIGGYVLHGERWRWRHRMRSFLFDGIHGFEGDVEMMRRRSRKGGPQAKEKVQVRE